MMVEQYSLIELLNLNFNGSDEIAKMFDDAFDYDAGKDQWALTRLVLLLAFLREASEKNVEWIKGTILEVPALCNLQALQAAYQLGKNSKES